MNINDAFKITEPLRDPRPRKGYTLEDLISERCHGCPHARVVHDVFGTGDTIESKISEYMKDESMTLEAISETFDAMIDEISDCLNDNDAIRLLDIFLTKRREYFELCALENL